MAVGSVQQQEEEGSSSGVMAVEHGEASVGKRKAAGPSDARAGFRGVRRAESGKYTARIWDRSRRARLCLGTFGTAEDAARAYDTVAVQLHGARAVTNFERPAAAATANDRDDPLLLRASCHATGSSREETSGGEKADRAYGAGAVHLRGAGAKTSFKVKQSVASIVNAEEALLQRVYCQDKDTIVLSDKEMDIVSDEWEVCSQYLVQPRVMGQVNSKVQARTREPASPESSMGFHGDHQHRLNPLWLDCFGTTKEDARGYDKEAIKLHSVAAQTNFKQPVATAANDSGTLLPSVSYDYTSDDTLLALLNDFPEQPALSDFLEQPAVLNDFLEQPGFNLLSHNIIPVVQLDDLRINLSPAGCQLVEDFLNDVDFT